MLSRDPAALAPWLGVGLMANLACREFVLTPGAIDYVAVTPDMFWQDHGADQDPSGPRFEDIAAWTDLLVEARLPQVAHHIGLSMASAIPTDAGYVAQMAAWRRRWGCPWLSEHLAFVAIAPDAGPAAAGLALTAPFDQEVLELVVGRARHVMAATGAPLLLENSAAFVRFDDSDMDEAEFLNRYCEASGGGLLLDLHNLYCNAVNHGFDAHAFLDRLDLANVVEVHLANGAELAGMWADAHSGAPPEPVWDLLADLAPRAPNLRAITFEFHDSYLPQLGFDGIAEVVARARAVKAVRRP